MAAAPHNPRTEISRKVLHLCSALIPVIYLFTPRTTMLWLLGGGLAVLITVEILRQTHAAFRAAFHQKVGFMVRDSEWERISGSTYVLVGALLSVALFSRPIVISGLLILSISDSAASLIGQRYGRRRFLGKSLEGSSAFFVTAAAILLIALPHSPGVALLAALAATLTEALPALKLGRFELNDNVTIPLATGVAIWLLQGGGLAW